jgi:hypothetical protein
MKTDQRHNFMHAMCDDNECQKVNAIQFWLSIPRHAKQRMSLVGVVR